MASTKFQSALDELRRKGDTNWKQNIDRQMETRAQQNKNQGLLERF